MAQERDPEGWAEEHRAKAEQGLAHAAKVLGINQWAGSRYVGEYYEKFPAALRPYYPRGVLYTYEGFPFLDRYASKTVQLDAGFRGPSRRDDFALANEIFGWSSTPDGYCWYPKEDGVALLLVESNLLGCLPYCDGIEVARRMGIRDTSEPNPTPLHIVQARGRVDVAEVDAAACLLDATFPPSYRAFLTETGGVKLADTTVPRTRGGMLMTFYSPGELAKWHLKFGRHVGFLAYIPHHYLKIGDGSGGAPCLRISGGDEGSIWWADFDQAAAIADETPTEDIMIRLADDFDAVADLFPA